MIILVTGGQRSGKSTFAQNLIIDKKTVGYIATSKVEDSEMADRVENHKKNRPSQWRTIEAYHDFEKHIKDEEWYIFECVGTMTSNILYDLTRGSTEITKREERNVENTIINELSRLIVKVRESNSNIIFVTNEVGLTLTPMNRLARVYTDVLGRVNQYLGKLSDEVYLVVSGIEVKIK